MRRRFAAAVMAAVASAAAPSAARGAPAPPGLSNAKIEHRSAAGGLAAAFGSAASGATAARPAWIAYAVPSLPSHHLCCADRNGAADTPCAGRCALEGSGDFENLQSGSGRDCLVSEPASRLLVFFRVEGGGPPTRVKTFSDDCLIDAGGLSVVWLSDVSPSESVSFLQGLAADPGSGRPSEHGALMAIALHEGPAADAALDRLAASGPPEGVRQMAVFWLGHARGRRGLESLRRLEREEPSDAVRKQVTFALSQSPEPEALADLIAMAKKDRSAEVRGQALFWLAQRAGHRAAAAIHDAIRDDPETEVKKRAVFALTQLPADESVHELIRVARTNRNPDVRRQAFFWLGQSKDPRAAAYIEEILTK